MLLEFISWMKPIVRNFNDKFKNKVLKGLAYRVRSQHQLRKYEKCMEQLK